MLAFAGTVIVLVQRTPIWLTFSIAGTVWLGAGLAGYAVARHYGVGGDEPAG